MSEDITCYWQGCSPVSLTVLINHFKFEGNFLWALIRLPHSITMWLIKSLCLKKCPFALPLYSPLLALYYYLHLGTSFQKSITLMGKKMLKKRKECKHGAFAGETAEANSRDQDVKLHVWWRGAQEWASALFLSRASGWIAEQRRRREKQQEATKPGLRYRFQWWRWALHTKWNYQFRNCKGRFPGWWRWQWQQQQHPSLRLLGNVTSWAPHQTFGWKQSQLHLHTRHAESRVQCDSERKK